ncbi:MAG: malate synthase A [Actinomycetota bacterium]|nr:malate synthase A [Actinomycetota bacterium]
MSYDGGVEVAGGRRPPDVLSPEAFAFVAHLHRQFDPERRRLLAARAERQARFDAGERPGFGAATRDVRHRAWKVAPVPKDLIDRRVEITGPAERKMMINALNSGARVFMADFEDSLAPTWANIVSGQRNLADAVRGTISFEAPSGRRYQLVEEPATLVVRPRGWHLGEKHVQVDGAPISASLFDFGLAFFHNARELLDRGSGPYFYLPKLESHLEARLWNDVFLAAQDVLGLSPGTIKATVLIETVPAAFEMDEILYELRQHSAGLNAGRWDYIFSLVKKFRLHPDFVLPDRAAVTMTVPFMRAYTELLVQTCHRRGAHAMGGMAAFVPNRRNPEVTATALAKVREDKMREALDGFDGTWVAHPDLVPVAAEVFDGALGDRPNQLHRSRADVAVTAADLLGVADVGAGAGTGVTIAGLRANVRVGIAYLASWLGGTGAAAIADLMEDVATAEICRAQVWQWLHQGVTISTGQRVTAELVRTMADEELAVLRTALGEDAFAAGRYDDARALFEQVAIGDTFVEFLTLPAYDLVD